jgi:hypothetical protein
MVTVLHTEIVPLGRKATVPPTVTDPLTATDHHVPKGIDRHTEIGLPMVTAPLMATDHHVLKGIGLLMVIVRHTEIGPLDHKATVLPMATGRPALKVIVRRTEIAPHLVIVPHVLKVIAPMEIALHLVIVLPVLKVIVPMEIDLLVPKAIDLTEIDQPMVPLVPKVIDLMGIVQLMDPLVPKAIVPSVIDHLDLKAAALEAQGQVEILRVDLDAHQAEQSPLFLQLAKRTFNGVPVNELKSRKSL